MDELEKDNIVKVKAPGIAGQSRIPTGLPVNDPGALARMEDARKSSPTFKDYAQNIVMGAAAGGQAATGSLTPLNAFIQGAAAGMQIPAQMAAQKHKQLQDTLSATPAGMVHPEIFNERPELAFLRGVPWGLLAPAIGAIAQETVKVHTAAQEEMRVSQFNAMMKEKSPQRDYKSERDMAADFNKLPEVIEYKIIKNAYNQAMTAPLKIRDPKTNEYIINGAGQLSVITAYIKTLNPQARFGEGTIGVANVGSMVDENTIDLYNKVFKGAVAGEDEINKMQASIRAKYRASTKAYRPIADLWADQSEEQGLNSNFVLSGDTGSGESNDDIYMALKAQHPGMTDREIFAIMKSQGY